MNGHVVNGINGHATNGHATNGHATNGNGHSNGVATDERTVTLHNGVKVPILGIGTSPFRGGYSNEAVITALKECGVRHIDTARMYQCEDKVGISVRESGIPREEVFISSKVWPTMYGYEGVKKSMQLTLKEIGIDYIDHYMLHYSMVPDECEDPKALLAESWRALEDCYNEGLCKSIGVSNFDEHNLNDLKETWRIAPHLNQIEGHIFHYPKKLAKFCNDLGIKITCYAPLAKGYGFKHPEIIKIAEEHGVTVPQVTLRWHVEHGYVCIPKSVKTDRVRENSNLFTFKLTEANMAILDKLHEEDFATVGIVNQESIKKYGSGDFVLP